jgi:hypothetical protein
MKDVKGPAFLFSMGSTQRQRRRRLLVIGGLALALILTLGVALIASQARASGSSVSVALIAQHMPTMMPTGGQGQCGGQLTVSSVTNRTITVTGPNGNTQTIYVTSHTQYVKAGQVVSVSAIKVGSNIYVTGSCGQGHAIHATRIEIVN